MDAARNYEKEFPSEPRVRTAKVRSSSPDNIPSLLDQDKDSEIEQMLSTTEDVAQLYPKVMKKLQMQSYRYLKSSVFIYFFFLNSLPLQSFYMI